jgi:hypothetical protein
MSGQDEGEGDLPEQVFWDDKAAVAGWARRLGVSDAEVRAALIAVGPEMSAVKRLLGKG